MQCNMRSIIELLYSPMPCQRIFEQGMGLDFFTDLHEMTALKIQPSVDI